MELDRRITLSIREPGTRNMYGERVEGALTEVDVWARFTDPGSSLELFGGGLLRGVNRASFRVRYRDGLLGVSPSLVQIVDERDNPYNTHSIREVPMDARIGRKRFIDIEVAGEVVP